MKRSDASIRRDIEMKRRFVHELAVYLVKDQAMMSIKLETGSQAAVEWLKLRSETPLSGWPTVEEAEETLKRWLGVL